MVPSSPRNKHEIVDERRVMKVGFMLMGSAAVFMGVLAILVHRDTIKLYPSSMTVDMVKGYAGRIEYALRYQTLLAVWLVFNIHATIFARVKSRALNPLDTTTEEKVQEMKNILTNSFESIVTSVFLQLIFVSFAQPECVLKFIPYINIVMFIGRIAFMIGYPLKRAFGYACTMFPNFLLAAYNLYKFGSFIGLYGSS